MGKVKEILQNICGTNDRGEPKCIIGLSLSLQNEGGEDIKSLEEESVYKPVIEIYPQGELVQMDICFDAEEDVSFQRMCNILSRYTRETAEYVTEEKNDGIPFLLFTLLPSEGDIEYFISAANPLIYSITALAPKKPVSCIRILFEADNLVFMETDTISTESLDVEVDEELRRREFAEKHAQDERAKRIAEMERIDALLRK